MFSKNWVYILCLCCVSFSFSSCKVELLDEPIIISLIDKEFSLELLENLQEGSNSLEVHFETISDENCLNTTILSSFQQDGLNQKLTIFEILEPETCDPGMAPAKGVESIGDLNNDISYPIQVELQDIVINTGSLTVSDVYYKIEMNEENGISWRHTTLFKIPQDVLWGYITYLDNEQLLLANDFVSSVEGVTLVAEASDGYYGHFEILNNNITVVKTAPEEVESRLFIRKLDGPADNITDIVKAFRANAPSGIELHIYDGNGNEW